MPSQYAGVSIQRKLSDGQGKTYKALCHISQSSVNIKGVAQPVNCVWVKEVQQELTKNKKELAEWFLLTNLPIDRYNAERVAGIYSNRWVFEDFHKCYKTGCNIEKGQFDSRKTLTTSIGLLAITAVMLLRSRYFAQYDHNTPFETIIIDKAEQELAKKLAGKYLKPIDAEIANHTQPCGGCYSWDAWGAPGL